MWKLVHNRKEVFRGPSLFALIQYLVDNSNPGDIVDIYQRARTHWHLVDSKTWGGPAE